MLKDCGNRMVLSAIDTFSPVNSRYTSGMTINESTVSYCTVGSESKPRGIRAFSGNVTESSVVSVTCDSKTDDLAESVTSDLNLKLPAFFEVRAIGSPFVVSASWIVFLSRSVFTTK